jgi:hypothetical protein
VKPLSAGAAGAAGAALCPQAQRAKIMQSARTTVSNLFISGSSKCFINPIKIHEHSDKVFME